MNLTQGLFGSGVCLDLSSGGGRIPTATNAWRKLAAFSKFDTRVEFESPSFSPDGRVTCAVLATRI